MTTAFINLKSVTLSLLIGGLGLIGISEARSIQDHDHGKHDHAGEGHAKKQEFPGDPYLLDTDGVSGKPLGPIDKQVIIKHDGRELRFEGDKTAATFRDNPAKFLASIDEKMIAQQLPHYPLDTCIVSGEKLGGEMGEPINLIYKNRLVRICCNGCKKGLAKDPAALIAKIDKAVIAAQSKKYPLSTCTVSDEKLGAMGDPIDYVIGNRLVRLCCKGCKKKVSKDPIASLAKLDAAAAAHDDHSEKGHDGKSGHHDR